MIKKIVCFVFLCLVLSCKKDAESESYEPKFVIEGSIEQGGYPFVTITHNLPINATIDSAQLDKLVIRYARVEVSDGQNTEVLTGYYDKSKFPYFYYKGSSITGQIGKNYQLKIDYAGMQFIATTTIPAPVALDSLWFVVRPQSMLQLNLAFTDPTEKNYYRVFTKSNDQTDFARIAFANQDDQYFNGKANFIAVNRGATNNLTTKWDPYFNVGDTVAIKFATMPKEGYDFWKGFENEIINSSNPLMSSTQALKTNIQGGSATGVWCGYGVNYYQLIARP